MKTHRLAVACALILSVFGVSVLAEEATPKAAALEKAGPPAALSAPNEAARRGAVAFSRFCVSCHGPDGDGRGPSAHQFEVPATNFSLGIYKCRSTPSGTLPTDADLRRSIEQGLSGTGMPQFVALNPLQLDDLVEMLKHLSPRFGREQPGVPLVVPAEHPNDAASIARGVQAYERLKCANCHGWKGEGGPGAANLHTDNGAVAHVTDFTRPRALKCGDSNAAIFTTLMTGLDGTPMSGYAEVLSEDDAWDVVHYVQSIRQ